MIYIVLVSCADLEENDLQCFGSLEKATRFANGAYEPTTDSGGWVQIFSYEKESDSQREIPLRDWRR